MKSRLASTLAMIAVTAAGTTPPISAVVWTPSKKINRTVERLNASRTGRIAPASTSGTVTAETQAQTVLRPAIRNVSGRICDMDFSWVTTCTSMSPELRTIVMEVLGRTSAASRPCLEAPTIIWVPLLPRAKSSTARAMSSPTTRWKLPPRLSVRSRCRSISAAAAPTVPSERTMCTATRSRPEPRPVIRAPLRSSNGPAGPPVRATTIRSRAAQVPVIPWSLR